jgi:hypothetical protein
MIHITQFLSTPDTVEYWREPTKEEIKFGHGALHYRSFDFKACISDDGFLKYRMRVSDDKLLYYYSGIEYSTAKRATCFLTKIT